jgi:uncharacterized protein YjbJ (UPF0337 family)
MSDNDIKDAAEALKLKAEARSERIEGKIRENLGEFSDDPEAVEDGQAKQEKAEKLEEEAENK